jgi:glycosyltransferase involved in cell wall biosynthesis
MGRVVRQTLRALDRRGEAEIVLVARKGGEAALREEYRHRIVTADALANLGHAAVWYPWNGMRFAPCAPALVTIHDAFAFTFPHRNMVARRREQAPIRRAIREADVIFAVSEWTAAELRRLFGVTAPRVQVVPNAADPFWQPVQYTRKQPYMFFLGGTDARKNAAMLFEAYDAAFAAGGPQLVVAGALSEDAQRRLAQMHAPHVRVDADDSQLRELYSGALAVLVPSLAEGFGLPAIEAMACGAPVIAADASALPETCAGAALLVPPDRPDEWSNALKRIEQDSALREELRRRGLERVRSLDPEASATALLECVRRYRADAL